MDKPLRPEVVDIATKYIVTARNARHKTEGQILDFLINSKVVDMTREEITEAYKRAEEL